MATKDLHNNIHVKRGISPAAEVTNNTAFVSEIVDTKGYESVEFLILTGDIGDASATFTTLVEDGDDPALADNAAVADTFLLGTEAQASFNQGDDNECFKIGYVGSKRYVRVTVTPANNSTGCYVAGAWLLGHARKKPAANPPQ